MNHPAACLLFSLGLAVTTVSSQAASSLILSSQPGWNGFGVELTVRAGFQRAGGGPDFLAGGGGFVGIYQDLYAPGDIITGSANAQLLPDFGALKDIAKGSIDFQYQVGSASVGDAFSFTIESTTSATTAMFDFGFGLESADSVVIIDLILHTFGPLDAGMLTFPGLPVLTAVAPSLETMTAGTSGPFAVAMLPGDPAITLPLTLGPLDSFTYFVSYKIVTPYGSDPIITYNITGGGASAVPEPSLAWLLGLVGCMTFVRRRR